jgi:methyltransferase
VDIAAWNPYAVALLLFVTLQRMAELVIAQRNTRRLLAAGAVEAAPEHYPVIVALHGAWLAGLWILAPTHAPDPILAAVYGVLQLARFWVLATLGERWTTRIIILPGAPLVRAGPYRFVDHPNYWVVAGEILILPCVFGLTLFALVFTLLNAAILTVRIRAEDSALSRPR